MGKSKQRAGRARRPIAVNANPLLAMSLGSRAFYRDRLNAALSALTLLREGKAQGVEEWRELSDIINVVDALSRRMRVVDHASVEPTVAAAVAALVACGEHLLAPGRAPDSAIPPLTPEQHTALVGIIDVYAACHETVNGAQMSRAYMLAGWSSPAPA